MPGRYNYGIGTRCPDCDGSADPWIKGRYFHKPICPTQPGHEEAQRLEDERRANRRRYLGALVNSREARRLRKLRSIGRIA